MQNRTESAWSDWVSERLQNDMPMKLHALRPSHTFTYIMDEDSMEILEAFPNSVEEIITRGVRQAIKGHWAYVKAVRKVGAFDQTAIKQQLFKDNSNHRNDTNAWDRLTIKIEFYPTLTMRQIGPKVQREPIVFDGRIIACSTKKSYLIQAHVFCPNQCENGTDFVTANDLLKVYIPKCPDCSAKMTVRQRDAHTGYVQTVKIQEITSDSFHKPIDIEVKVTGDNVFNTWIGKRIRIAGQFITDLVMDGKQHEHKHFVFAKYIHEIDEVENVCITRERAEEIKELIKKPDNFQALLKSFAPNIEDKLLQKEGIMYSFVMGSKTEVRRTHIHVLEIGNAGKGKSEMIKQIPRVIAKSKFVLANNSTAAGLGIGMVKMDSGTSEPAGGPLVMLSPDGTLALDELDKMHPEDQKALLSSMENQVVTKTVAGTDLFLPSYVSIISAANPKWGQWDNKHGIVENINFPAYLLTRFDHITCSVKTNAIKEQEIANKILGLEAVTEVAQIQPLLSEAELMQYINYCKKFNPKLTIDAKNMLKDFYQQMCQATEGEDNVIPMTPRELEGMIRMATARAKLFQRDEADCDDVQAIMDLKTRAMNSFPNVNVKNAGQQIKLMSETDDMDKLKIELILEARDEDGEIDEKELQQAWVDRGVCKNDKVAEREFGKMIGINFFQRGSRYLYTP
jgi:replicative DNA helicase Mcm